MFYSFLDQTDNHKLVKLNHLTRTDLQDESKPFPLCDDVVVIKFD